MRTNYSTEDIAQIKNFIHQKQSVVKATVQWVEKNLKYEQRNEILLQLKGATNTFHKILQHIDAKPVMALFGASQVGKSYLIKNLLSTEGHPLKLVVEGLLMIFFRRLILREVRRVQVW